MAAVKGDRVIWRGRQAKVLEVRSEELTLHVGEGQIVRQVGERDYTVVATPAPDVALSTQKPSQAKPHIAKARSRKTVSTGKGK